MPAEWTGVTTTVNFPVDKDQEIEVSCSDPSHLNIGEATVTCIGDGDDFRVLLEHPLCKSSMIPDFTSLSAHFFWI